MDIRCLVEIFYLPSNDPIESERIMYFKFSSTLLLQVTYYLEEVWINEECNGRLIRVEDGCDERIASITAVTAIAPEAKHIYTEELGNIRYQLKDTVLGRTTRDRILYLMIEKILGFPASECGPVRIKI